jgi:hypothetical protein
LTISRWREAASMQDAGRLGSGLLCQAPSIADGALMLRMGWTCWMRHTRPFYGEPPRQCHHHHTRSVASASLGQISIQRYNPYDKPIYTVYHNPLKSRSCGLFAECVARRLMASKEKSRCWFVSIPFHRGRDEVVGHHWAGEVHDLPRLIDGVADSPT